MERRGIGTAGVLTYLFFALASHNLSRAEYGQIVVLWSAVMITISVVYRPVEQLLSRTLAERLERGLAIGRPLRIAASIQLSIAVAVAAAALLLREPLENTVLEGKTTLYWVLVVAVICFGASYYARGFLAGTRRFGLLAGLIVNEAVGRFLAGALPFLDIPRVVRDVLTSHHYSARPTLADLDAADRRARQEAHRWTPTTTSTAITI